MSNEVGFCAAIQYELDEVGPVHSDICWHQDGEMDSDYIQFLHDCLDEWLRNSNGTGCFWIGDVNELRREFSGD